MARRSIAWVANDTSKESKVEVPEGASLQIGRTPDNDLCVTGDPAISRKHAVVRLVDGEVFIECLEGARNPVVFGGKEYRQLKLSTGSSFVIGDTKFRCLEVTVATLKAKADGLLSAGAVDSVATDAGEEGVRESTYSPEQLKRAEFGNARHQIEILANLPHLIAGTHTDEDLALQVAKLLLDGIPQAVAAAVVRYPESAIGWAPAASAEPPTPMLMRGDVRKTFKDPFRPSRRLMLKCLSSQQSAMHIMDGDAASSEAFTMVLGLGWAFAAPIRGEACRGWCLYVSGKGNHMSTNEERLQGDLRFTELLAQFIGSIRQVRTLQTHKTQLSAFFSPKIIENLTSAASRSTELAPAERDVTVLFCDLRGFSKVSEALQRDLPALLRTVSEALGVMASGVLTRDGAIADFQGDAILGFWGWPIPDPKGPWPACHAALVIADGFRLANEQGHPLLAGLSAGIGVAHGRALAGRIGTEQQAKIGVFGPVVNQGSRIEGMTKQFGVSICIDHAAATYVRKHVPPTEARTRLLARVRPKGMDTPLNIHALLPGEGSGSTVSSGQIAAHEAAVTALVAGKWPEAREALKAFSASDGPANFLRAFLAKSPEVPPADWDGAIRLESK